jgi:hypothetical protein
MLKEKLGDLWFCSCSNWVGRLFTWRPQCLEDRDFPTLIEGQEREKGSKSVDH